MRWLTRLILLVAGMVLLTGIVSGGLALKNINVQFQNYLGQAWGSQAQTLAEALSEYYEEKGTLEGADVMPQTYRGRGMGMGPMMTRGGGSVSIITSDEGKILWHPDSREIGSFVNLKEELKLPVINRGQIIAYLFPLDKGFYGTRTLEAQFINSVLESIIWGTVFSVLIAIFLGLLFSKSLLDPLRHLIQAARHYSRADLEHRLEINEGPDFNEVYTAFNEMAENLSRQEKMRRELVADVAHELRTPLTILSGNLESIQEGIEPANPENLASLHDEVYRLRGLVDDLQQLSLAEAKQLPLYKEETNMVRFLQETVALFEAESKEREINISLQTEGEIPAISIDKRRIRQILINLLTNSLRYISDKGRIGLMLKEEGESLIISVSDNGPGIAPEDLPHVFNRFYRGDKSRSRLSGGSGLGLAIVKGLVEAHGGTIWVESSGGHGTIFWIRLPLQGD